MARLMDELDPNNDGHISATELLAATRRLNIDLTKREAKVGLNKLGPSS